MWDLEGPENSASIGTTFVVMRDINKGKDFVFGYTDSNDLVSNGEKLLAASLKAGTSVRKNQHMSGSAASTVSQGQKVGVNSTAFQAGSFGASSSGVKPSILRYRRRPSQWIRKAHNTKKNNLMHSVYLLADQMVLGQTSTIEWLDPHLTQNHLCSPNLL